MSSYDPFGDPSKQVQNLQKWAQRNRRVVLGITIVAVGMLVASTSYYQIEPEELGVVLRFGKHIENTGPGPHFKLPLGIDRVLKVPVQRQLKMEFGFRTLRADVRSEFQRDREAKAESMMLTGDRNVAIVEWIIQYRIESPEKYLFQFRNIRSTLRLMAEATMRSVVGDHSVDEVLTEGRAQVEQEARAKLIELNVRYDTGIAIELVKLQTVNVPGPVIAALREVEEAKQERERMINDAWAEYNKVIPRAEGRALQAKEAARGYAVERVNRAKGDATRFRALVAEYRKAPAVTRTRLYLEAMGEILLEADRKLIIDSKAQGLIPLLNLGGGAK
ncbi:MAG: FtsH protease activity modulator HflK [Myxococcota bacterium]